MVAEHPARCVVGKYLVDVAGRRVVQDGRPVELSWRGFDALCLLMEAEGRVVEREAFFRRLWPGMTVDETNLTKVISQLRRTLSEGDNGAEYVETVPRVGYRLTASVRLPVEAAAPGNGRRRPRLWAAALLLAVALPAAAWAVRRGWTGWERREEAERAYREGLQLVRKRRPQVNGQAAEEFRKAIRLRPDYALAHAGLAETMHTGQGQELALAIARRAVELDRRCGECEGTLGFILLWGFWKWDEAGEHHRKAIALKPRDAQLRVWQAQQLAVTGQLDAALEALNEGVRAEPYHPNARVFKAAVLHFQGRHAEAVAAAGEALALDREHSGGWEWRSRSLFQMKRYGEALDAMFRMRPAWEHYSNEARRIYVERGLRASLEWLMEQTKGQARDGNFPYYRAMWFSMIGERERAIEELEAGVEQRPRPFNLMYVAVDPAFTELRGEPRFRRLVERMGLRVR